MEPQIDDITLLKTVIAEKKFHKTMSAEFGWRWSSVTNCTVGNKYTAEVVRDYFLKRADSYKAAIARGEHFENENLFREALSPLPESRSPEVRSPEVRSPEVRYREVIWKTEN